MDEKSFITSGPDVCETVYILNIYRGFYRMHYGAGQKVMKMNFYLVFVRSVAFLKEV